MFENYIVKGIGGFYYVKTADGVIECKAKGIFRKQRITPVAGDIVCLEKEGSTNVIAEIKERKNVFVRPAVANVDMLFIVVSTVQPVPSTLVIDKLAAIAVDKHVQPILVITKTDIASAKQLQDCYRLSKIPVIETDMQTEDDLAKIKALLNGKVSVFCGNSGVGKSTLLGRLLPHEQLETAEISVKLGRGKHTTREAVLFEAYGGLLADTPGFSSLEMARVGHIEKEQLQYDFEDIAQYVGQCKFADCSHTGEHGCAVRAALENEQLSPSRYESYVTMYKEAAAVPDWNRR